MRALFFQKTLQFREDLPVPDPGPHEALIRTRLAGVCSTDLEILRGYGGGFTGVPGHEFVGEVVRADGAHALIGRRVVGEINCYCGECPDCRASLAEGDTTKGSKMAAVLRTGTTNAGPEEISCYSGAVPGRGVTHCSRRSTLGIRGRDGVMADYFTLPIRQLHPVPDSISDESAVFVEPLAAACEIIEQVDIRPHHRVLVLGDGKLGLLIAQVLQLTGCNLSIIGRHSRKLAMPAARGIDTRLASDTIDPDADIVVEATGSPAGFAMARALVRPRGTLVLKSTFHGDITLDVSGLVVDEITLIGSRCGPFAPALALLAEGLVEVAPLIQARFPLDRGLAAFDEAATAGALKILLFT